jgi:hypothetical protein
MLVFKNKTVEIRIMSSLIAKRFSRGATEITRRIWRMCFSQRFALFGFAEGLANQDSDSRSGGSLQIERIKTATDARTERNTQK